MNRKNGSGDGGSQDVEEAITPFKVKIPSTFKQQRNCVSPAVHPQPAKADVMQRINDHFTHPWTWRHSGAEPPPPAPLKITYHKPRYNPPCYFSESLKNLSKSEKALKIMSYHFALSNELSLFQQGQPQYVLLGDPIQSSNLFNGTLDKKRPTTSEIFPIEEEHSQSPSLTYVSRSGRTVKKRVADGSYCYDEDEEKNNKRIKREESPKVVAAPKRANKKLSNDEIISRSSLFADSPVQNKSQRTQAILQKAMETESEKRRTDVARNKFEETLAVAGSDDDDDIDMAITSSLESPKSGGRRSDDEDDDDTGYTRTRIPPPAPTRKGKSAAVTHAEMPSTSTATPSGNAGRTQSHAAMNGVPNNGHGTPKRGTKKKTTGCPICGGSFPIKEIEQHASTCGLTSELEIHSSIPNKRTDHVTY